MNTSEPILATQPPARQGGETCTHTAYTDSCEWNFHCHMVDRPEAVADAEKARRLLAMLIARRIVCSVSSLSDNKEKMS